MRSALVGTLLLTALVGLGAPSAQAAGPSRGCAVGWVLSPVSALPAGLSPTPDNVNRDGLVCLKPISNGSGSFTNFVDNLAR